MKHPLKLVGCTARIQISPTGSTLVVIQSWFNLNANLQQLPITMLAMDYRCFVQHLYRYIHRQSPNAGYRYRWNTYTAPHTSMLLFGSAHPFDPAQCPCNNNPEPALVC